MEKNKEVKTKVVNEAGITTITDGLSSVKLIRAAGNEIRPEIKVYNENPDVAIEKAIEIMKIAIKEGGKITDELNKKDKVNE